ncbi:MAG: hypothetical protein M4579_000817 [Chaenotheca gracillima]|nr:MAG: hypothetical protein M4579_000817 [Chaenotheca gracillima]
MAQIPNLNTLRAARGSASRGGRGRGTGLGLGQDRTTTKPDQDRIVQQTDQDASVSRLSAIQVGYLNDPFARDLASEEAPRRFPIINRGTYVRTTAIDRLTEAFVQGPSKEKKQIISLGAGSDTRYFRLASAFPETDFVYHELDFPANTRQKISSITKSQSLLSLIRAGPDGKDGDVAVEQDGTALYTSAYNLHPIDLRNLKPPQAPADPAPPSLHNVDPTLPTLLISECCLIYLTPTDADAILRYFTTHLFSNPSALGLIIYEPINPNDPFGQVMVQNLAARGIVLQTLKRYASLSRQKERMRVMGFGSGQGSADVDFLYERWVDEQEKERVTRLEMLDEVEEWMMLAQHYCVAWAWRDAEVGEHTFKAWEEIEAQTSDE